MRGATAFNADVLLEQANACDAIVLVVPVASAEPPSADLVSALAAGWLQWLARNSVLKPVILAVNLFPTGRGGATAVPATALAQASSSSSSSAAAASPVASSSSAAHAYRTRVPWGGTAPAVSVTASSLLLVSVVMACSAQSQEGVAALFSVAHGEACAPYLQLGPLVEAGTTVATGGGHQATSSTSTSSSLSLSLSGAFVCALRRLFRVFDVDEDALLCPAELALWLRVALPSGEADAKVAAGGEELLSSPQVVIIGASDGRLLACLRACVRVCVCACLARSDLFALSLTHHTDPHARALALPALPCRR